MLENSIYLFEELNTNPTTLPRALQVKQQFFSNKQNKNLTTTTSTESHLSHSAKMSYHTIAVPKQQLTTNIQQPNKNQHSLH